MEKTITVINLYFLKIRDFFKEHKKWNPFENKWLFCFIPVLIGWICAIHYHAMYQSCDDWDMRVVLEGTAGGFISKPSNFSMYMTVLYGNFLKFFYDFYPNGYWYDIFQSLFATLSIYFSSLFLCKDFEKKSNLYKCFSVSSLSFVSAIAILSPQFTITSGILGVSGVFSFFMIADNYFHERKYVVFLTFYCIFAFFFGGLIRFNACLAGAFYTGLLLLPFWPYRDFKKLLIKSVIPVFAVLMMGGIYIYNAHLVEQDPVWKEGIEKNITRASIHDNTNAWDHPTEMWLDLEDKLNQTDTSKFSFSKADYRMLLTTSFLGEQETYSAQNLSAVSKELSPLVSLNKTRKPAFRVGDYRENFGNFIALFCVIALFGGKKVKQSAYFAFCFYIFIFCMNIYFRDTPYRMWYVFVFSTLFSQINFVLSNKEKSSMPFVLFGSAVLLAFSFMPLKKQISYIDFNHYNYKSIVSEIGLLDRSKSYLLDYMFKEGFARPFKRNPFVSKNILFLDTSPLNHWSAYSRHNDKNFWLKACSSDKIKYLAHSRIWKGPLEQYKKALSYFIKEKYGKTVAWIAEYPTQHLITYQCRILTEKEIALKKAYKKEVADVFSSAYSVYDYAEKHAGTEGDKISLINFLQANKSSEGRLLKYRFARKTLGQSATLEQIEKFIDLMDADVIEEFKGVSKNATH